MSFNTMEYHGDTGAGSNIEYNDGGIECYGIMSSSMCSLPDENDSSYRSDVAVYSLWDVLSASTSLPSLVDEHQLM